MKLQRLGLVAKRACLRPALYIRVNDESRLILCGFHRTTTCLYKGGLLQGRVRWDYLSRYIGCSNAVSGQASSCQVYSFQEGRALRLFNVTSRTFLLCVRGFAFQRPILLRSSWCVNGREVGRRTVMVVRIRFYSISVLNISFVPGVSRLTCPVVRPHYVAFSNRFLRNYFRSKNGRRPITFVKLSGATSFWLHRRLLTNDK